MKYMVSNEYPHSWKDIPEERVSEAHSFKHTTPIPLEWHTRTYKLGNDAQLGMTALYGVLVDEVGANKFVTWLPKDFRDGSNNARAVFQYGGLQFGYDSTCSEISIDYAIIN